MQNLSITLAYDGSSYKGWQDNKGAPNVEATLRNALETIFQEKIVLQAASRTDAGVHAQGQVLNFFTEKLDFPLEKLERSLNGLLPPDIVVLKIGKRQIDFHPSLDAKNKEYHYHLCRLPIQMPQNRLYSWHFYYPLDLDLMRQESQALLGKHDFSAFCNIQSNESSASSIRELRDVTIRELEGNRLRFEVKGTHFLYKMVRNIVGYLSYVGCGKLKAGLLPQILNSRDRRLAGITAPAHGLTLFKINY
jgi:tRNA pseudouridine38-40 synthase